MGLGDNQREREGGPIGPPKTPVHARAGGGMAVLVRQLME